MNIKKFHDEYYLKDLISNKKELNKIIIESKGYVLHVMEKKKFFPPLDFLIEDNNPYKLLFIIKNYELSRDQIREIRKFFSNSASNKVASDILKQEEVEQYLKENTLLPPTTVLNLETLHKYSPEIQKQFQIDDYSINNILENSVKLLKIDEFLSIDEKILKLNMDIFNAVPHFFNKKIFKEKYIKLLFDKEKDGYIRLHDFRNFQFMEEDLLLLKSILAKDEYSYSWVSYQEVLSLKGAGELIDKMEYFRNYNSNNITHFTSSELKAYKTEIQDIILKGIPVDRYDLANYLLKLSASQTQFEYIIDKDFLIQFIKKIEGFSLDNYDLDTQEYKEKSFYFKKIVFSLIVSSFENKKIIDKFSFYDLVKTINSLKEKDSFPTNEILTKDINKFYIATLPKLLNSENFSELLNHHSHFIDKNSIDSIELIAKNNPNINLLTVLLNYNQKMKTNNKNYYFNNNNIVERVEKVINYLISSLDRESVKKLTSYYNYNIPLLTLVGNYSIGSYENNFLNIKDVSLKEISEVNLDLLLQVDSSFKKTVLDKKIIIPSVNLKTILNRSLKLNGNLSFLKKYIKINKNQFLEDEGLLTLLIKEPLTKDFIKIDSQFIQIENYKKLLDTHNKIIEVNLLTEVFYKKGDYESAGCKELEKKKKDFEREIGIFKDSFTFDFIKEKIKELVLNKKFEEFLTLKEYSLTNSHYDIFYSYVNNSNFNTVLKDLENIAYRSLIKSTINRHGSEDNNIQFSNFNQTENSILAGMLLPILAAEPEKESYPEKIFQLFPYNKRNFLNDFIVKNMPLKMFYSYYLSPNVKEENSVLNQVYTNQQIIEAFNKIEKEGNFFNCHDVNISCDKFFKDNFKNNEKAYRELLNFAKDNNPKLYVILGNKEIFSDFLVKNEKKYVDELVSDYCLENFNIDILIKGFKQIFEECKAKNLNYEDRFSYNSSFALSCVRSVIHNTYYDKDINNIRTNLSPYSTKDSDKLVEFFFNEAPLFLMNSWAVGNINSVSKHIEINFGKYIKKEDLIDTLLVSCNELSESNFNISKSNGMEDYRAQGYLTGMINHYLQEEKEVELDYISFLIERYVFFQDELNRDVKYNMYSQTLDFIKDSEDIKNKLNITQSKFSLDNILAEKEEVKNVFKRKKL